MQTLTTGIFSVWLESANAGGAAQIASVVLVLILVLMTLEKFSRRRLRFHNPGRQPRPIATVQLKGAAAWVATFLCVVPFVAGFVLPVGVILSHAINNESWFEPGLLRAFLNTLTVGGAAALMTVLAALFLVYGVRLSGKRLPRLLLPATTIGYAAPGAVLAVGILLPLAKVDHFAADTTEKLFGIDIGLVLTGTAFALVYSYAVRFFAVAQGATESAMGRISPSLPMAARSLGRSARGTLLAVYVPLIRGSVGTGLLLVFVDCVKELPATLLLRPFNYDTLATRVYEKASLEDLGAASPAALLVMGVGLLAVIFLARTSRSDLT